MEQLKMTRRSAPVKELPLPEGFSYEFYRGLPEQRADWLKICKEGLIAPDATEATFDSAIAHYPDLEPLNDLIFVRTGSGERVATIAFVLHKNGAGYVHMVCCLEAYRGRSRPDARGKRRDGFPGSARSARRGVFVSDDGRFPVGRDQDLPARRL